MRQLSEQFESDGSKYIEACTGNIGAGYFPKQTSLVHLMGERKVRRSAQHSSRCGSSRRLARRDFVSIITEGANSCGRSKRRYIPRLYLL